MLKSKPVPRPWGLILEGIFEGELPFRQTAGQGNLDPQCSDSPHSFLWLWHNWRHPGTKMCRIPAPKHFFQLLISLPEEDLKKLPLIKHRTKFTAAVAVAAWCRCRSISSVFVWLNAVDVPNPMKNNATSGPAIWMRYLIIQPKAIRAKVPITCPGTPTCSRTRSMGKLRKSCCFPLLMPSSRCEGDDVVLFDWNFLIDKSDACVRAM